MSWAQRGGGAGRVAPQQATARSHHISLTFIPTVCEEKAFLSDCEMAAQSQDSEEENVPATSLNGRSSGTHGQQQRLY